MKPVKVTLSEMPHSPQYMPSLIVHFWAYDAVSQKQLPPSKVCATREEALGFMAKEGVKEFEDLTGMWTTRTFRIGEDGKWAEFNAVTGNLGQPWKGVRA